MSIRYVPGGYGGRIVLNLPDLPIGDEWLTTDEALAVLGVKSKETLRNAESRQRNDEPLPVLRVKGRKLYRRSHLERYKWAHSPEGRRARARERRHRTLEVLADERPDLVRADLTRYELEDWLEEYDRRVGSRCDWMRPDQAVEGFYELGMLAEPARRKRGTA